ncbi:MAG: isoprenyl transferase [Clostridia bacterium]|nr:isoprenyl transferase [Clostridia bacterium]
MNDQIDLNRLPRHIGVIMDGNGRWAKKRLLPRMAGHSAGANNFKTIARHCNELGIKYLTVYAFSTENWKRSKDEVDNLFNLFRDYLIDSRNFKDENMRLKVIGDIDMLPKDIVELIHEAEENSKDATGTVVNLAINYGGRDELVYAVKKIAQEYKNGDISIEDITEKAISDRIYTADQPDPDLIIRPSGEFRLSNFMIWQSAYSEFWFSNVLWPDFKPSDLDQAIIAYQQRDRRFGDAK